jgi:hypothetical protein
MMGDEFYAIIKLVSGEELIALVSIDDTEGEPIAILQNPVVVKVINHPTGAMIKVKPWMELVDDKLFVMKADKIITMTETEDENIIRIYKNYIFEAEEEEELTQPSNDDYLGSAKLDTKMGYLCSVEDARKLFEELYKLEDTKES